MVISPKIGVHRMVLKCLVRTQEELEMEGRAEIIITKDTEKSPGDLKRLTLMMTLVKDHQITLVLKTHKE